MKLTEIVKRILPFASAVLIGSAAAGFFVALSPLKGSSEKCVDGLKGPAAEIIRLKVENKVLRSELKDLRRMEYRLESEFEILVPTPPVAPLMPVPPVNPVPPAEAPDAHGPSSHE